MKNAKTIGALGAVAVAALIAAGCGSPDTTSDATPVTSAKATTTTVAKATPTDAFVNSMKTKFPNASRADLIDIGRASCDVIDAFGSVSEAMIAIAMDPTWDREMAGNAGYTMGAAIPVFCPQHLAELNAITD